MKTKFSGLSTLLLVFLVHLSFAQEKTITGTITDENGLPLPGTSVVVKGTTQGTQSDFDGNYTIIANTGQTLVFGFLGYQSIERTIGVSNTINIQMVEDAEVLGEVVVTALGISRDKKSLGYATQEVGGEEVSTAREANFVNSLSGKVSGVNIKKSNTLGGSTNVVIRGYSSISQSNQALFVVDGVQINNSIGSTLGGGGGYDYGNAASDINPDDIESINVLKGAAATALYGSRAVNGAIIITTKKGRKNKGLGITVNSTLTFSQFDSTTFPEFQYEYGAGYGPFYNGETDGYFFLNDFDGDGVNDQVVPSTEDASFGAPFDGRMVYQWDAFYPQLSTYAQPRPWIAPSNGPETFFETGVSNLQNIAFDGGTESASFRLSYTRLDTKGILPNSTLDRNTVDFNGALDLTDRLTASVKTTFIETKGLGRYGTGYSSENLMTNFRQWWQTNVDIQRQRDVYFETRQNITWNPNGPSNLGPIYWDNPYWTRYENYQNDKRTRLIGNFSLNYKFADWFDVMGRITVDTYSQFAEERTNIGSVSLSGYTRRDNTFTEYNYDLLLNFNKDITENIGFRATIGSNTRQVKNNNVSVSTNGGLVLPRQYSINNSANPINFPFEYEADQKVIGLFANASLDFNNILFLEGSVRRDQSSTLPSDNNVYYYPSGSASFVFSGLANKEWLSFGKLRFGYAQVGNSAPPYSVFNTFNAVPGFQGNTLYSTPGVSQNPNLREERTESLEAGLELNFLNRRLGIDFSVYDNRTKDLITNVEVTSATGFFGAFVNAGEIKNSGVEATIYGTPVQTQDFEWKVNVNWATNNNEVVSLFGDTQNLLLNSFFGVTINATVGEPYGTIKGTDYIYLDGERVVNDAGLYEKTESRQEVLGDINPDWKAGINNSFRYKNFSLSFLIDMQQGGDVFSGDMYFGLSTGLYKETAGLNDLGNPLRNPVTGGADSGGVILNGVQADGSPNTLRADFTTFANPYGRYGNAPDKQFVYDASYVKLREVALSYALPKRFIERLPFTNVVLSATGRNLWIIHKNLPYADPEATLGTQIGAYPSTRDYAINLRLQF